MGNSPSYHVLSDRPSQYVLRYQQSTYEERKAMFGEWEKWVPYPPLKTILCLPLLRTWHIRMNGHPRAQKNGGKTAPNDIPNRSRMREVGTRIRLEWGTDARWNWAGMDRKGQVIEKDHEEHFEEWVKRDLLTGHLLSEWATKHLRGAEYTCGGQRVDLGGWCHNCAHWMKQVSVWTTSCQIIPWNRDLSTTPRLPQHQMSFTKMVHTYLIVYLLHF